MASLRSYGAEENTQSNRPLSLSREKGEVPAAPVDQMGVDVGGVVSFDSDHRAPERVRKNRRTHRRPNDRRGLD